MKLLGTMRFISNAGDAYRYEIYQDKGIHFAVIYKQEDIVDKNGINHHGVWVQINGNYQINHTNIPHCEMACESHFDINYKN
ncbi:TPA: hypothetical protein ON497_001081 [Morganella morganii]|nr:hypothetical protein [Morganella morganii]